MSQLTSVTIKQTTKNRLTKFARFGESWDDFINRVCEKLENEPTTKKEETKK